MRTFVNATSPDLRVGVDLCSADDVAASIERFGDRYLRRIYTDAEVAYSDSSPAERSERLAARFAAKEAVVKVLRPTAARPDWRDIEVRRDPGGWCDVVVTGQAAQLAESAGLGPMALSLTHEHAMACAVVVASVAGGEANIGGALDSGRTS